MIEPPIEAKLAEVLDPRWFRRWLLGQGDRLFPMARGGPNPLGWYLRETIGPLDLHMPALEAGRAPSWSLLFGEACDGHPGHMATSEAVRVLDLVLGEGDGDDRI